MSERLSVDSSMSVLSRVCVLPYRLCKWIHAQGTQLTSRTYGFSAQRRTMVTIQKQFAVVCFTAQGIYVSLLCLPTGDSSVLKESGEVISMAELRVDDRVLAGRKAYCVEGLARAPRPYAGRSGPSALPGAD